MEDVNRYWLFIGLDHYPGGGIKDLHGTYKTLQEAKEAYSDYYGDTDPFLEWCHIYDIVNQEILLET